MNGERVVRRAGGVIVIVVAGACATAPPAPAPVVVSFEQKMSWVLRLEDQRVLRDPAPATPVLTPARGKRRVVAPPPPVPNLADLLSDPEARVRRRAALAIGRTGISDGVPLLLARLADEEPEVRQMAAFALGLLGDKSAVEPLRKALGDPSPIVQGRAAEALGLLGDAASATAIAEMVTASARAGALAAIEPDELTYPLDPSVEAFRLGVFALTRLKAYDPLAAAVLDASDQPVTRWWPVAYALGRIEDRRAAPALGTLARSPGTWTRAFAARGLGILKNPASLDVLTSIVEARTTAPLAAVSAVRALGQIGNPRAAPLLLRLAAEKGDDNLRLEAVTALGSLRAATALDPLLDLLSDPWPSMRAAAFRAVRDIDPQTFLVVLSGLDPDRHWSVRAALASILGTLEPDVAIPRLTGMLADPDLRVIPPVLAALVRVRAPAAEAVLLERLESDDVVVRTAAATGLGDLNLASAPGALAAAYERGQRDGTSIARSAALSALAKFGAGPAVPLLTRALGDKDWAVRLKARALLQSLDPAAAAAAAIRPAPTRLSPAEYEAPALVAPTVSPHVYVETDKGPIEIELAVLDAPLTVHSFMALARKGYFNGLAIHRVVPNFVVQDGDPRGDGEGGPGYTIRDEVNQQPYLRGTVGMALDGPDTGGSQFFITHSPQPHLDARYTVFGRVVNGMEVVDRLQQWDTIRQVRVWDGVQMGRR
jgi:cyclophilin family peptidyl-prolyl cis-trans isomerase/HEAT repeat protein